MREDMRLGLRASGDECCRDSVFLSVKLALATRPNTHAHSHGGSFTPSILTTNSKACGSVFILRLQRARGVFLKDWPWKPHLMIRTMPRSGDSLSGCHPSSFAGSGLPEVQSAIPCSCAQNLRCHNNYSPPGRDNRCCALDALHCRATMSR